MEVPVDAANEIMMCQRPYTNLPTRIMRTGTFQFGLATASAFKPPRWRMCRNREVRTLIRQRDEVRVDEESNDHLCKRRVSGAHQQMRSETNEHVKRPTPSRFAVVSVQQKPCTVGMPTFNDLETTVSKSEWQEPHSQERTRYCT